MEAPTNRVELTPISFLERSVALFADKTAVVHGTTGRRYSYRQLAERVERLAAHLRDDGLARHDRVAILCPNIPALLEAHFAVPAAGGILVAINTRLTAGEIDYILRHSGARVLLVDAELAGVLTGLDLGALKVIRVDDTGADTDPYEAYLAQAAWPPQAVGAPGPPSGLAVTPYGGSMIGVSRPANEEEPISINYTSGTTGRPKGVVYSHRGAYLNATGVLIETGLRYDSVYLWTLPMFHCNGWCTTWAVVAAGATSVCLRRPDPALIWQLLEAERVTHYNGAPTVQIGIVNHSAAHRLTQPVTVGLGGAPPSPTLLAQSRSLNLRPLHLYGLTETYGPATARAWHGSWETASIEEQARDLARQGQAHLTAGLVRVVDAAMQDVPRDGQTLGEVVMRGNTVMAGYYQQPEATAAAFQGGWFHSGDLAVWHPDGQIELRDRAKDIIISGGENISTIEVEQVIVRHPAVLECAVIAIPDDRWGERPKAFVALKAGQTTSAELIIAFCQQHLAKFKCPSEVEFGELPKTSTGKVQKYLLRERAWAGRTKRIN